MRHSSQVRYLIYSGNVKIVTLTDMRTARQHSGNRRKEFGRACCGTSRRRRRQSTTNCRQRRPALNWGDTSSRCWRSSRAQTKIIFPASRQKKQPYTSKIAYCESPRAGGGVSFFAPLLPQHIWQSLNSNTEVMRGVTPTKLCNVYRQLFNLLRVLVTVILNRCSIYCAL